MGLMIDIDLAMLVSVIVAEMVTAVWFNLPWRSRMLAVFCNIFLVGLLRHITARCWSITTWEQTIYPALWVGMLFVCLEAPYRVSMEDFNSMQAFSEFSLYALHKFTIVYIMLVSQVILKRYG